MGLLSWLGFGGVKAAASTAETISSIASQWIENPAQRQQFITQVMDSYNADVRNARSFGNALPGDTGFSAFADGVNKMIRPVLAMGVIGGLYEWWPLPDIAHLPAFYSTLGYTVIGFYFGAISIFDDLPRGVAKLIKVIRG